MYRDAKEELKRLEEALLEEENQQDSFSQWDLDEAYSDIPDLPKKKKNNTRNRNKAIFALTVAVIILTAAIAGLTVFLLIGYGRWFS